MKATARRCYDLKTDLGETKNLAAEKPRTRSTARRLPQVLAKNRKAA
jgi:hypothetical protein